MANSANVPGLRKLLQGELEGVALEFVQEVRRLRGDSMARMVARALGLGG